MVVSKGEAKMTCMVAPPRPAHGNLVPETVRCGSSRCGKAQTLPRQNFGCQEMELDLDDLLPPFQVLGQVKVYSFKTARKYGMFLATCDRFWECLWKADDGCASIDDHYIRHGIPVSSQAYIVTSTEFVVVVVVKRIRTRCVPKMTVEPFATSPISTLIVPKAETTN